MTREENIKNDLMTTFGWAEGKCTAPHARRVWAEAQPAEFAAVLARLHDQHGFTILCTITGIDAVTHYDVIYHLAAEDGIMANLKLIVPKDKPVIQSVIPTYNGAVFYERELVDLLGLTVDGLPAGHRYPLPDNWPAGQYPLRKDWQPAASGDPALPENQPAAAEGKE